MVTINDLPVSSLFRVYEVLDFADDIGYRKGV